MQKSDKIEIKSLEKTDFDIIYEGFSSAFIDYEFQPGYDGLWAMLKRRGFDLKLSFAAFDGEKIVSFVLNGIGHDAGRRTAYDTGTGTVKEYRGRGLAGAIFEHSIPFLKKAGITQYLLEVLQHNDKAVSLYKKQGFEVRREFNYFFQKKSDVNCEVKPSAFSIKKIEIGIDDEIQPVASFWDFKPSWQNSFASVERAGGGFICLGAFDKDKLIGYCIFEPSAGDITQLAVCKEYRRKGVGTLMLNEMLKLNKSDRIGTVNTEQSCDSITQFLKSKNIGLSGKQYEMIKRL